MLSTYRVKKSIKYSHTKENSYEQLTPFELLKRIRYMMDDHHRLRISGRVFSTSTKTFKEENKIKIFIAMDHKTLIKTLRNVHFPNLTYLGIDPNPYFYYKFPLHMFEMPLNEYKSFFDNDAIKNFWFTLLYNISDAYKAINLNPNDEVYKLLLVQNEGTFRTILNSFEKSVRETSTVTNEALDLFNELLTNFSNDIIERSKNIPLETFETSSPVKDSILSNLKLEADYQRKIRELNQSSSVLTLK